MLIESSSYYYDKARQYENDYNYHMRQGRHAQTWADSYVRKAQGAQDPRIIRDAMYTANQYQKAANEHYESAQKYLRESRECKSRADKLARRGF